MKNTLVVVGILVLVAIVAGGSWFWFVCPCERTPGGPLSGNEMTAAVDDWSFVNEVGLCQLEVDRGIPWSVNLNCMSDGGDLFSPGRMGTNLSSAGTRFGVTSRTPPDRPALPAGTAGPNGTVGIGSSLLVG